MGLSRPTLSTPLPSQLGRRLALWLHGMNGGSAGSSVGSQVQFFVVILCAGVDHGGVVGQVGDVTGGVRAFSLTVSLTPHQPN